MNTTNTPRCTAFLHHRRVAAGSYPAVAQALAALDLTAGGLLVFDDATGSQVDYPWPAGYVWPQPGGNAAQPDAKPVAHPSVGRPKLGVVAREVTLLPRHWEWLAQQRGGASAALRRLVDEARRTTIEQDNERRIKENSYRFMSAIAGALPGYEEATRALFGHDGKLFAERIAHWPADIQVHLAWMTRDAFPQ
ncbi:DUF2239 family protein [Serratia fonticola]|uniref:DUF2239 family protein n=1 Tax=Serratia fonticola TaxID=47917 RepID=UPI002178AB41|nr:DUF2239 family protein [Serratia fonticola]CAI1647487.1 Uncharacterized protein conserved in bacteria [Serratia fonticola]CAI1680232.1 Uncharacterized protein conserved in bacteria [Serratia fonticola]CAI1914047.1 Uncharacterized protein conserved in bacteria [Serratia fonticola]CAI1959039.1 Uncharacterized protein conserved in bacteria [Serratia fonticola]